MAKKKDNSDRIAISTSLRLKPTESANKLEVEKEALRGFTNLLASDQTQLQCYNAACAETVEEFLGGQNCTLFVYGQTGSGKTHTLFGPPNSFHAASLDAGADEACYGASIPKSWGAFPRMVLHLLQRASESSCRRGVTATAVEIYMDNCYDLMSEKRKIAVAGYGRSSKTTGRGSFLETTEVRRDRAGKWVPPRTVVEKTMDEGYRLTGAKSAVLKDVRSLLDFMRVVEATRTSKSHKLNERSSRSHCVITLTMPAVNNSKCMCVDLAGSERIVKTGTIKHELKAAEAKNINTSLTSLGRCISSLAKGSGNFVPYRDSVLTMLLKQALGGRCYTSVIITASEEMEMHSETISSIKFGSRCAKVANRRHTQQKIDTKAAIAELLAELQGLDNEIQRMQDSGQGGGMNKEFPTSLQLTFANNMEKYQDHKSKLDYCKQKLKSRTGAEAHDGGALEKTKKYEESQVRNLQGILLRSMTTGVWTDPCPSYIKLLQRRTDLVNSLIGMNENFDDIPAINVPLTFEHLMLGFEG